MAYLVVGMILAAVTWLVLLNIAYYRARRAMTPDERKRDDDEMRDDMFVW